MRCPSCGFDDSKVVDSRVSDQGAAIRRRRECNKCAFRFTTFERMQTSNLVVEKQDGTTEPYSREKLEKGILIACGKRPVSMEKIREKLGALEDKWGKASIIKSKKIGEDVVELLRDIDEIAYIRFASVYKEFRDAAKFRTEFEKLFK